MSSPEFEPNPDLARYIALTRRRAELEWQILCRERIDIAERVDVFDGADELEERLIELGVWAQQAKQVISKARRDS